MTFEVDGREALDELYWRAEILQALYWMRGEGLAGDVDPGRLAEFLAADAPTVADQMERLAGEGYLEVAGGHWPRATGTEAVAGRHGPWPVAYRLTALGVAEGGRSFHDEFDDYIRPAHAECGPGCWCKDPKHAGEPCPNEPKEVSATR